jgi:DNA-binding NarL/FixJ family response regulator
MNVYPVTVVVVDDHPIVLHGIVTFLKSFPEISVAEVVQNGAEVVRVIEKHMPDIILLDIALKHCNGLDLIKDILRVSSETKVIVYTNHTDRIYIQRAFKCGARGYLLKCESLDEIVSAFKVVDSGRIYLSPNLPVDTMDLLIHGSEANCYSLRTLTAREHEIAYLLSEGLDVKTIAAKLHISQKTIWVHRQKIMKKIGCSQSNELMVKLLTSFPRC